MKRMKFTIKILRFIYFNEFSTTFSITLPLTIPQQQHWYMKIDGFTFNQNSGTYTAISIPNLPLFTYYVVTSMMRVNNAVKTKIIDYHFLHI